MKGVLSGLMGGKHAGEKGDGEDEMEEAEEDDASIDAMGALLDAMKAGDKSAALEAFRALQLAED